MPRDLTKGVEIIKSFEGLEDGNPVTANLDPYICPGGYWTIGWGHAIIDSSGRLIEGPAKKVAACAVYPQGITIADAQVLLNDDVRKFSAGIEKVVKVPVSDARFCALLSFAFNVGLANLGSSTLLRLLNQGKPDEVPAQFLRWTKSKGVELAGLKRRRTAEADLWRSVPS
jgi:lysozyme